MKMSQRYLRTNENNEEATQSNNNIKQVRKA